LRALNTSAESEFVMGPQTPAGHTRSLWRRALTVIAAAAAAAAISFGAIGVTAPDANADQLRGTFVSPEKSETNFGFYISTIAPLR